MLLNYAAKAYYQTLCRIYWIHRFHTDSYEFTQIHTEYKIYTLRHKCENKGASQIRMWTFKEIEYATEWKTQKIQSKPYSTPDEYHLTINHRSLFTVCRKHPSPRVSHD